MLLQQQLMVRPRMDAAQRERGKESREVTLLRCILGCAACDALFALLRSSDSRILHSAGPGGRGGRSRRGWGWGGARGWGWGEGAEVREHVGPGGNERSCAQRAARGERRHERGEGQHPARHGAVAGRRDGDPRPVRSAPPVRTGLPGVFEIETLCAARARCRLPKLSLLVRARWPCAHCHTQRICFLHCHNNSVLACPQFETAQCVSAAKTLLNQFMKMSGGRRSGPGGAPFLNIAALGAETNTPEGRQARRHLKRLAELSTLPQGLPAAPAEGFLGSCAMIWDEPVDPLAATRLTLDGFLQGEPSGRLAPRPGERASGAWGWERAGVLCEIRAHVCCLSRGACFFSLSRVPFPLSPPPLLCSQYVWGNRLRGEVCEAPALKRFLLDGNCVLVRVGGWDVP